MSTSEVATVDISANGPHGDIPLRIYSPVESDHLLPGLVWAHGGAFIGGDLDMPEADWVSRSLAQQGFVVVSVSYRLAVDGIHYPVPSDDVVAAYRWVQDNSALLGIRGNRLSMGGASAGGNLAAGAALRLRDAGAKQPHRVLLAYPILHANLPDFQPELTEKLESLSAEDQRFLDSDAVFRMNINYAGNPDVFADPYAFPANADPTGLPPHIIVNSDADTLRASGESYAALLAASGVTVMSHCESGTKHGHINRPEEAAARRTLELFACVLRTS